MADYESHIPPKKPRDGICHYSILRDSSCSLVVGHPGNHYDKDGNGRCATCDLDLLWCHCGKAKTEEKPVITNESEIKRHSDNQKLNAHQHFFTYDREASDQFRFVSICRGCGEIKITHIPEYSPQPYFPPPYIDRRPRWGPQFYD